ncbi:unnamed protein product [Meloidogyne enterolobii]|uniref:Uncharacterized protein n=1 Tax=Meloidogyne enterolobii TaxID=390850 RepID=A0ACB0Y6W4_MELEN
MRKKFFCGGYGRDHDGVTKILKIWMTELLGERVPFFRVRRVNAYLSMQKKIIFMGKGINKGESL